MFYFISFLMFFQLLIAFFKQLFHTHAAHVFQDKIYGTRKIIVYSCQETSECCGHLLNLLLSVAGKNLYLILIPGFPGAKALNPVPWDRGLFTKNADNDKFLVGEHDRLRTDDHSSKIHKED